MLNIVKLLLPAIVPSWRFFDEIVPSPRIQYAILASDREPLQEWQEFRVRPRHMPFGKMLGRMLWNPRWNESLYLVSCAERLLEQPTRHSEDEILARVARDPSVASAVEGLPGATFLQFRLMIIRRKGNELVREVVFESRCEDIARQGGS